jgi:hypothetical protein
MMPRTVGIIAGPADTDAAQTLARELTSANWTCVMDATSIDAAPVTVIVCSSHAPPSTATARMVEHAFARGARLLPVLIDLQSPPPQLSHFLAGLRCLECTRAELPAASARLRRALDRMPEERREATMPRGPEERAVRTAPPLHLNTWSAVVRVAALVGIALAAWRLPHDLEAVRTASGGPDTFAAWARGIDELTLVQALPTTVAAFGFLGWLRAALRSLVLAHRERQVRSWLSLWGGYILALAYPPLAVGTICRVWASLAGGEPRSPFRMLVVSMWWVAVVITALAPTVASVSTDQGMLNLTLLAADPPDADAQLWIIRSLSLTNAASLVMFALTLLIARGSRDTRPAPTASAISVSQKLTALVLGSRADRLIADVLANRLRKYGIDFYVPATLGPPDLATYDVVVVLGRGDHPLEDADLALIDTAVDLGRPPVFPLSWRSESPPSGLQARLGPLHWHRASFDDGSLQTLATALLKSARRTETRPASGVRLGVSTGPRIGLARTAVAGFVLGAAWSIASLGRSFADFDFHALLIIATGVNTGEVENPFVLGDVLLQDLAWRTARLLPAVAGAVAVVWVFTRLNVRAAALGLHLSSRVLFETRDYPARAAGWLVACVAAGFATMSFDAPKFVVLASSGVTLGLTAFLFAAVGAARKRLRALVTYWDPQPIVTAGAPMPAVRRSWIAPLTLTAVMAIVLVFAMGLMLAFNQASLAVRTIPNDPAALAAAENQMGGTIAAEIFLVHLPSAALWWWWLGRRAREARAAGREHITRARRALALLPLVGHVDLSEIVRESTAHRYGQTSFAARAVHALATAVALAWTVSLMWLTSAAWARDVPAIARTIMTSTAAFLFFALASTLLWWVVGLTRGSVGPPSPTQPDN